MMKQTSKAISTSTIGSDAARVLVEFGHLWQKGRVPLGARMLGTTMFWGAIALSSPEANAAELGPDRPPLPAMSLEDHGALSIWRNPANLGFDPDPAFAFLYGQGLSGTTAPESIVVAANTGPFGLGVAHQEATGRPTWTTISSSLALPMGENFYSGIQVGWQIPDGPDNNFATVDLGTGWRPLSWWGMSLVGYNLGVSGRHTGVEERLAVGSTFRPANDLVEIGGSYHRYTSIEAPIDGYAEATVKLKPIDGLTVRLSGNQLGT